MKQQVIIKPFIVIFFVLFVIIFAANGYAADTPKAENVGENKWYNSGNVKINVYQLKNGEKVKYTDAKLSVSRTTVPTWNDAKENSYDWNFSIADPKKLISLKSTKYSTKKKIDFVDPKYTHEGHVDWSGYNGFIVDVLLKMPKGYKYQINSYKTNTLNLDSEGRLNGAMTTYMPKLSYEKWFAEDDIRDNKLIIHASQLGIMTMSQVRYTGNSIEFILEPNITQVTYDSNGGNGTLSGQTITYNSSSKIKDNTFERYGYTFSGWNTAKNGSGKAYKNGQDATNAFPSEKNVTLYAQWKPIKLQGMKFAEGEITGIVNTSKKTELEFTPSNALNKSVKYSSSNQKNVRIADDGTMQFMDCGSATVTAYGDGGIKASIKVTVKPNYNNYAKKEQKYMKASVSSVKYNSCKMKVTTNYKYTSYKIYLRESGKHYKLKKSGKKLKTYSLKRLSPGKKYTVKVKIKVKGKWKSRTVSFYTNTVIKLKAVPQDNGNIKLSWTKFKGAVEYVIERKEKTDDVDGLFYRNIKTTKATKYVDTKVKSNTKYHYRVFAYKYETKYTIKKTKKGKKVKKTKTKVSSPCSNVVSAQAMIKPEERQKNIDYVKNDAKKNGSIWKYVMGNEDNVNDYHIPQDYGEDGVRKKRDNYSAIKYKFTGAELEIHLYLEFLQYSIKKEGDIIYAYKSNSDNVTFDGSNNYKSLCMKGLFQYYDKVDIKGNAQDFQKGFLFKTKLFVHDKNTGRCYSSPTSSTKDEGINNEQYYIPVCLGGECPLCNGVSGYKEHWYHHDIYSVEIHENVISKINKDYRENQAHCIYMPDYKITLSEGKKEEVYGVEKVHYVCAHEMGHVMGLGDAYTVNGTDRMTDNSETCKMINEEGYDNLMYQQQYDIDKVVLMPNDIEMMLTAYTKSYGHPWAIGTKQWYKNHAKNYISPVIKNTHDEDAI